MSVAVGQQILIHISKALMPVTNVVRPLVSSEWAYIPAFMLFFIQLFSVAMLWMKYVKISSQKAPFLGSCAMSSFHSIICIFAGYAELSKWQPLHLDASNTPIQSLQLQFSLGYLLADTLYFVLFDPNDIFFVAHHALAGLYIWASLRLGVGGISAIFVFFMGEITSPLFNVFNVAKELKDEHALASKILLLVSPVFTFFFVIVRSIISPVLITFFLKKLLFESDGIPVLYRVFMASLVTLGMIGSQVWSYKLIKGFRKARAKAKSEVDGGKKAN